MKICPSISELSDYAIERICPEVGCGKKFSRISNLQLHLVKHHKTGTLGEKVKNAQFHCPVTDCVYNPENNTGRYFSERRLLKQHYAKVHAPRNWSCVKCGWCSAIPASVRRHTVNCKQNVSYPVIFEDAAESLELKTNLSGNPVKINLVNKVCDVKNNEIDIILQEHNYVSKLVSVISPSGDISLVKIGNCDVKQKANVDNMVVNNEGKVTKTEPSKQSDRFTQTLAKTIVKSNTSIKSNVETQTTENYKPITYDEEPAALSNETFSNCNFSSSDMSQDIETQTALDELLYSNIKQTDYPDSDIFSDIQTQTPWPLLDLYTNEKDLKSEFSIYLGGDAD